MNQLFISAQEAFHGVKTIIISIILAVLGVACADDAEANCKFIAATATLAFGNLDPGIGTDVSITSGVIFRCLGPPASFPMVFTVTDDDGLHEIGPNANRMRNTLVTTEYLPYNLSISPTSGSVPRNTDTNITLTGTVKGIDYINARVGSYSDTVTLTIAP